MRTRFAQTDMVKKNKALGSEDAIDATKKWLNPAENSAT